MDCFLQQFLCKALVKDHCLFCESHLWQRGWCRTLDGVLCPTVVWKNNVKIKMQPSVDVFVGLMCRKLCWCACGRTVQHGVVPACSSLSPLGLQEHWLGFVRKDSTWCLQPPAEWKQSHQKNPLFSQWGASTVVKQLRFCIIWGTESLSPTLVLIIAFGVFWEGGQWLLSERVEGISHIGDQSWRESSMYRTLKTASVWSKLSCSLKATPLAVSMTVCQCCSF